MEKNIISSFSRIGSMISMNSRVGTGQQLPRVRRRRTISNKSGRKNMDYRVKTCQQLPRVRRRRTNSNKSGKDYMDYRVKTSQQLPRVRRKRTIRNKSGRNNMDYRVSQQLYHGTGGGAPSATNIVHEQT